MVAVMVVVVMVAKKLFPITKAVQPKWTKDKNSLSSVEIQICPDVGY